MYLTGTSSDPFEGPSGENPNQGFPGGELGTFVVKLDAAGAYQWHTFLDLGWVTGSALGGDGSLYVTGKSNGNPGPNGEAPLHGASGGMDLTIFKLDAEGGFEWHTFYGSVGPDSALNIAAAQDALYAVGVSPESWHGPAGEAPLQDESGESAFLLKLFD